MREEEAFCMFVKLMSKYGLREMFTQDMPGLHLHLYQFERLLEDIVATLGEGIILAVHHGDLLVLERLGGDLDGVGDHH